jgi:hypothetical protein
MIICPFALSLVHPDSCLYPPLILYLLVVVRNLTFWLPGDVDHEVHAVTWPRPAFSTLPILPAIAHQKPCHAFTDTTPTSRLTAFR